MKRRRISRYLIKTIENYLKERMLAIWEEKLLISTGVPQGSVLGPTPRNITNDGFLKVELSEGCEIIGL